jgi:hypothetical protein
VLASQSVFILMHHTDISAGEGLLAKWEALASTRPDVLCANPAVAEVRALLLASVEQTRELQERFRDIVTRFNKALVSASESYEAILNLADQMHSPNARASNPTSSSTGTDTNGGGGSGSDGACEVKEGEPGESPSRAISGRTRSLATPLSSSSSSCTSWSEDKVAILFDELANLASSLAPLKDDIHKVTHTLTLGLIEASDSASVSSLAGALLSLDENCEELKQVESCLKVISEVYIYRYIHVVCTV